MSRFLNIGLMQYNVVADADENLEKIKRNVEELMNGLIRPEIILGPELCLGRNITDTFPGKLTEIFSEIAKKHAIYFLPGSIKETDVVDGVDVIYNTLPIFGPDGTLIDKYRKICPWYPAEGAVTQGNRYVVFDIKEKGIRMGVMICHDWCFPEISRNLALMGAEILFRPAVDPEGVYEYYRHLPSIRGLENQAYFISLNTVSRTSYGHTMVVDPEGRILYEAGRTESNYCIAVDVDQVTRCRTCGSFFMDQLIRQVKLFKIPMPFAEDVGKAPVFDTLPEADRNCQERLEKLQKLGINSDLGRLEG